jgi:4-alpha-glucanotransferase
MDELFPRSSGILLHPTSLPGPYGIGDLGQNAYRFVDWLVQHGQSVWQILPLGPTSYGDSPYQTLSAFAGNPNLISLDQCVEEGWLKASDLQDVPDFPADSVDYGPVIDYHNAKLHLAYEGFVKQNDLAQLKAYEKWCADEAYWLDDFALYVAIKNDNNLRPWTEWPAELVHYEADAIKKARKDYADAIEEEMFRQWVFYAQWYALKYYANNQGVRLFGDIPIFVAHDSADVWANQRLYFLNADGTQQVVAGVPPDYFSATGQRWGNPLYRWDKMQADGYAWWISRFKAILTQVDYIRIDHFRGFDEYWEIPAEEPTAIKGEWKPGPGPDIFKVVEAALGHLPIIAEDLGVITQTVEQLRDDFGLPGMKVLQFAWSDPKNTFLPHNHVQNAVIYTGTHDNNTTIGWWLNETDDAIRNFMQSYLARSIVEVNWEMMRIAMMSPCHTAIFPMQDVLNYGPDGRMNTPGIESGNWRWRFTEDKFEHEGKDRLAHFTGMYQRRPDQQEREYGDTAIRNDGTGAKN